jgi:response regulator RpfG family c-di-GMP phosphodiesterase
MELEKILIVDDDTTFANLVRENLMKIESIKEVDIISSGVEFFKQFMSKDYSMVILDYLLSDIDGLQILIEMKEKDFNLPVVMLTGKGDESVAVDSFQHGVIDYIIKYFENINNLPDRILRDFELYKKRIEKDQELEKLRKEKEELRGFISELTEDSKSVLKDNKLLKDEIKGLNDELAKDKNLYESIVYAYAYALDKVSKRVKDHTKRVTTLSLRIGRELKMSEENLKVLYAASLLHNIGSAGQENVQIDVLLVDTLKEDQQNLIKNYCEMGSDIINNQSGMGEIARFVLYQFERWDGKGFPYGLKKDEIPLISRIIRVADTFDMITTHGYGKKKFTREEALKFINDRSGTYFDPNVVLALNSVLKDTKS